MLNVAGQLTGRDCWGVTTGSFKVFLLQRGKIEYFQIFTFHSKTNHLGLNARQQREDNSILLEEELTLEIKDGEFGVAVSEEVKEKQSEAGLSGKRSIGEAPDNSNEDEVEKAKEERETRSASMRSSSGSDNAYYQSHDEKAHESRLYCNQCDIKFSIKRELVRHRKIAHGGETRMLKIRQMLDF